MGTIQRKIGASVERKTAAFTAVAGGFYLCNTVGGSFTATLPSGTAQDIITFSDDARTWGTVNLIVAPATGETIDGLAANETLVCDLTGAFVTLTWNGTTWTIATNGFASSVSNGSLSSGSGSGSKNYILNTNSSTNWAASDAGILVADETTAGNLPDNSTQTTALRVTRVSGTTSYARYRFVLDQADYGKKFQLSFDMKYAGAAGDYKLEIYSFTSNAYTSGTFISPVTTDLPALSAGGTFTTTVDMPGSAAPYIEFRIRGNGVSTPIYLNSVYAGPGIITQGAAVSERQTWTPSTGLTLNATGKVDPAGKWYRVGQNMTCELSFKNGSGGAASGTFSIALPTGYTLDTSALPSTGAAAPFPQVGTAQTYNVSLGSNYDRANTVCIISGAIKVIKNGTGSAMTGTDILANAEVSVQFTVPIAEWAGNGTVNLGAGAQVEYAADDGSADVFGPNGALVPNVAFATGNTFRDFSFNTPQGVTQAMCVELNYRGNGWSPAGDIFPYSTGNNTVAANAYGVQGYWSSSTVYRVAFGNRGTAVSASNLSDGASAWATEYAAGTRFRVSKANPSSPVGFGLAGTDGSSGLVAPYSQTGVVYSGTYTSFKFFTNKLHSKHCTKLLDILE
jgi:hypothetical protein